MVERLPEYLFPRNGRWYLRVRVPIDLVPLAGTEEIKYSLGTNAKKGAKRQLRHELAKVESYFDELRRNRRPIAFDQNAADAAAGEQAGGSDSALRAPDEGPAVLSGRDIAALAAEYAISTSGPMRTT
jgi:hypothetical protein